MEWGLKSIFIWGSVILCLKITHQAGNVASRGIATQSAELASAGNGPVMAIDYPSSPADWGKTCASVPLQDNPWWKLDLRSIYHITGVSVTVSTCCQEQLNGAEIRIGLRNDTHNQRCATFLMTEGQHTYDYKCEIMLGRFVHIVLSGQQKNLTLCEVMVYGTVLENVAVRGIAFQSTTKWRTSGRASNVVDGVQFTTCSITEAKPDQWVKVDLLVPYNVTIIQLALTIDCADGVEVYVDDTRCSGITSCYQSLMTFDCGGTVGRNVSVFHPIVPLSLCEVEVYSNWEHPENIFPQRPPSVDYCSFDYCSRDYIFIDKEPMTWSEAQTYCRESYTDLATVDNPQEMNTILDKMTEKNLHDFWIGLYEDVLTWRWSLSDGGYYGDVKDEFANWAAGEPNTLTGVQHCVGIQDTGEWKDLDCGTLNYFLCFDGREGASQTKILVQTPMTWAGAQQYCRKSHSDLVRVRSLAENEEIRSLVPAGMLVWIGLFGDSWKWSDGRNTFFRYWQQEQAGSSVEGPNCAQVNGGAWRRKSCDSKSTFLCYRFKKKSLVKISADFDMCDPAIQQQIQKQLEEKLKNKGINHFKIHWRTTVRQLSNKKETVQCLPSKGGKA